MNQFRNRFARYGVGALALTGAVAARADAIDVSGIVSDIAAQATPVGLIGVAVLVLFVAVKAFRWVRGALA